MTGWSSLVARQPHKLEATGSIPVPVLNPGENPTSSGFLFVWQLKNFSALLCVCNSPSLYILSSFLFLLLRSCLLSLDLTALPRLYLCFCLLFLSHHLTGGRRGGGGAVV